MSDQQSSLPSYPSGPGGGEEFGDHRPAQPSSTLAITAFVLSLVGVVIAGAITGIPGVILGHRARKQIQAGRASGSGLAMAAIVLGYLAIVSTIIGLWWFFGR